MTERRKSPLEALQALRDHLRQSLNADQRQAVEALKEARRHFLTETELLLQTHNLRAVVAAMLMVALETARDRGMEQEDFAQMVARTLMLGGFEVAVVDEGE